MSALNVHTLRRKNTMQIIFFAIAFRFVTCCSFLVSSLEEDDATRS